MDDIEIPTPQELLAAQKALHDREAEKIIREILVPLRADPTRTHTVTGSDAALSIVALRMSRRGWTCELYEGSPQDPGAVLLVRALRDVEE